MFLRLYATVKRALIARTSHESRGRVALRARSSYLESALTSVLSQSRVAKGHGKGACGRLGGDQCIPLRLRCVAPAIHHVGIAERLEQHLGLVSAAARSSVEHDGRCLVIRQDGDWHRRIGAKVPNNGVGWSRVLHALVWRAKVDENGPRSDAANILRRGQNGRRRR